MSISMAKEVFLSDITVHQSYLEDALLAVLHTILFVRAPDVVNSKDFVCQSLRPLVFATCGEPQVHKTIE